PSSPLGASAACRAEAAERLASSFALPAATAAPAIAAPPGPAAAPAAAPLDAAPAPVVAAWLLAAEAAASVAAGSNETPLCAEPDEPDRREIMRVLEYVDSPICAVRAGPCEMPCAGNAPSAAGMSFRTMNGE